MLTADPERLALGSIFLIVALGVTTYKATAAAILRESESIVLYGSLELALFCLIMSIPSPS